MNDDRDLLLAMLNGQRNHVVRTMEGMPEEFLLAETLPSRWSPAGLIRHLTHDVERFWFREVMMAEPDTRVIRAAEEAWDVPPGSTGAELIAAYREECERSDEIVRTHALSDPPAWWDPSQFGHGGPDTLREIILHVMVETATHAGHMDIVRELYDGRQNLVFTNESRPGR